MTPAGVDRVAQALRPFLSPDTGRPSSVLLAVSGGPDSTALMHAASGLDTGAAIHVATVDHGLRPGSDREAEGVGTLARSLGLPHRILPWGSPRPETGLQESARAARYRLLGAHAAEVGASLLLTAHTGDDQAETVLMRLIAGSGPAGLAGMRARRLLGRHLWLGRPFLDLPKADLVAYCEQAGLPFVHDPTNCDDRFARARLRKLLPLLETEGFTVGRLQRLARRLARDEAALSRAAEDLFAKAQREARAGTLVLDGVQLRTEPEAIVLRVVEMALALVAPVPVGHTRLERLERLVLGEVLPALHGGGRVRRTLRGVLVETTYGGELRLSEAPPRRPTVRADGVAAAPSDLLGNDPGTAYIAEERVGSVPLQSGTARTPPRISR